MPSHAALHLNHLCILPIALASAVTSSLLAQTASAPQPATISMKEPAPLTLLALTPLSGIEGDFDTLSADLKADRLYIASEEHHSIEVFKASTGEHLSSVPGVKVPHALAVVPEKNELVVADGGDSSALFLSLPDLRQVERVPLIDGSVTGKTDSPDTGVYDSKRRTFFIGNGGVSANLPYSEITELNVDTHHITGRTRVEGNNLEAMAIDEANDRLFVDVRDKKQVAVVDLKTHQVVNTWNVGLNRNTALAFDPDDNLVFVGSRNPGLFTALDASTGEIVAQLPCANTTDFMAWDSAGKRVYIAGSAGLSIFHQERRNRYTELARLPTNGGKTALLIPELHQLLVVHPKSSLDEAGLLVYRVNR